MNVSATAVIVDLAANVIRLVVPDLDDRFPRAEERSVTGVLDVGANGRLLGVELEGVYVNVMDSPPGADAFVRSATVRVGIARRDVPEISLPRHGRDYEITYPSGNQCWQVTTVEGTLIQLCATSAGESGGRGGEGAAQPGMPG